MKFKYLTAPLFAGVLPSEILGLDIQETKATCDNCLMARPPTPRSKRYNANLKCCTFYPYVPNFAVGAILQDTAGRYIQAQAIIRSHIQRGQYSLPIGLVAPLRYQLDFKKRKIQDFGNSKDLLCPYYDQGKDQCSIWAYRGAVCSAFYCKSSAGRLGKKFWRIMTDYLAYVEMALMEEALIRLDFSPRQISENLEYIDRDPKKLGGADSKNTKSMRFPIRESKRLWRDYYVDQERFFIKCYEITSRFDRRDFREMMGQQGQKLEDQLLESFSVLKGSL